MSERSFKFRSEDVSWDEVPTQEILDHFEGMDVGARKSSEHPPLRPETLTSYKGWLEGAHREISKRIKELESQRATAESFAKLSDEDKTKASLDQRPLRVEFIEDSTSRLGVALEKAAQEIEAIESDLMELARKGLMGADVAATGEPTGALRADTLKKVGEQLGTNEGGWYQDTSTKERYYLKTYRNPDQARIEFLTNAIYRKLGINAPDSQLLEKDGRIAIAAREIPGAQPTRREDQRDSQGVRNGFVADAYLANWDVVGLEYDNIVKDANGHMVRVDNGGSLTFRAQGETKPFSPDAIPELQSMLTPEYPAGKVFGGISEEEMKAQAAAIVKNLSPKDIEALVKEAGLPSELAEKVQAGLLGRREVLIKRFGLQEREARKPRLKKVFEELDRDQNVVELGIRPRESILGDSNHIENQQIDFIDRRDKGFVVASFKLTETDWKRVNSDLFDSARHRLPPQRGQITYESLTGNTFNLCSAWEIEHEGLKIKISTGSGGNRSGLGLVNIEIPVSAGSEIAIEEIEQKVAKTMADVLGVEDGLTPPSPDAERAYKEARFRWHQKLSEQDQLPATAEKLERREVFPGYFTMVDDGRHEEYTKEFGRFAIIHSIGSDNYIPAILRMGLMSSHERFRRGLMVHGMSSTEDFETGGADSVFTRIAVEASVKDKSYSAAHYLNTYTLVFAPNLLDRTDWYAYSSDEYGSTSPGTMSGRLAPSMLLKRLARNEYSDVSGNEEMFRTGISPEAIRGIACTVSTSGRRDAVRGVMEVARVLGSELSEEEVKTAWQEGPRGVRSLLERGGKVDEEIKVTVEAALVEALAKDERMNLLLRLEEEGIVEINGRAIHEAVVDVNKMDDLFGISEAASSAPVEAMAA
jgi:hypothetical protein